MEIAVVGAGINGLCIGWEFAKAGHAVTLFERDSVLSHTSRASSKLLHGGLRYLETGAIRLVREALRERQAWFERAPELAKPVQITLPVYERSRRGRRLIGLGLWLYDGLARGQGMPAHRWLDALTARARHPDLKADGLLGAFQFWDGLMDDHQLGLWVAAQARLAGATIIEHAAVVQVSAQGTVGLATGEQRRFDRVINAAGPWARHLLQVSDLPSRHDLDLVRGSHLVLERPGLAAYLLEVPNERRVFFVLPWQQGTLVGTTEVRETYPAGAPPIPPTPNAEEIDYLLRAYNCYFTSGVTRTDIRETFSGLRPLVKSAADPTRASREYVLEPNDRLITVFGGKWTTACALARKVHRLAAAGH